MRNLINKSLSTKTKLRLALLVFFLALSIPTLILIKQAYSQLKWEAFHQHQALAEELSARINRQLIRFIKTEEARPFNEYRYLVVEGDQTQNFLQRSPLSKFPIETTMPGLLGYFQVDADNQFSTPLLPIKNTTEKHSSLSKEQRNQRQLLQNHLYTILSDNQLAPRRLNAENKTNKSLAAFDRDGSDESDSFVESLNQASDSTMIESDYSSKAYTLPIRLAKKSQPELEAAHEEQELPVVAAFDQLNTKRYDQKLQHKNKSSINLGRVEDLKLDSSYQEQLSNHSKQEVTEQNFKGNMTRRARKERSILPEAVQSVTAVPNEAADDSIQVNIFESEIDPLEISLLDSGHFILYRKVWRNNQRFIQGLLLEQQPFINGLIETAHRQTTLSNMSDLITAYHGDVLSVARGIQHNQSFSSEQALRGSLLYQTRLSAPFSDFELIYSVTSLPVGPGSYIINWVGLIIILVLCIGTFLMYRLSLKQMSLAEQQQDFVSAVSHELKTPITSIRMYGEMLKEGWADENKKNTYYHFIFDESERLTRLINNILQLARMTRNDIQAELKPIDINTLLDNIQSKVSSQIERAGFTLKIKHKENSGNTTLNIDVDLFIQIIINLIDNALKFSAKATNKTIELNYQALSTGDIEFSIRDYGPGIPKNQLKKIFTLFYRSENELTRETVGTGIGLALVHQLTLAMHGKIDVINTQPGCCFKLIFPLAKTD